MQHECPLVHPMIVYYCSEAGVWRRQGTVRLCPVCASGCPVVEHLKAPWWFQWVVQACWEQA